MESYHPNRPITGEFDRDCAVKCLNGTFVGKDNEGVVAFRGIPFAQPPVGKLRWKDPVPVERSDGVFEAFYNAPSAIQTKLESERASFYHQSEDCLYLNVWTAKGFFSQKRPVMVFIHGGNYSWGGTADPLYDGHNFVKAYPDIVLVTIAYRIGIMGFIDLSGVPGGESYPTGGNLGLLDQIAALQYVQENIESFGGDPSNVTIFGESAGAGSVSLLPLIPASKGLFSRVIAESGSVALTYSKEECAVLTSMLLKETGAKTMDELCALTEEQLMEVNKKLNDNANFPERDGVVIPLDPYAEYKNGSAHPVDMMIGSNADELRYWILDVGGVFNYRMMGRYMYRGVKKQISKQEREYAKEFIRLQKKRGTRGRTWRITEFFNDLLFRGPAILQSEAHASHGYRTYMYYWTYPSAIPLLKACHAVELSYVFNNSDETIYTGEKAYPKLADAVQRMWVNFAKTGDPSIEEARWEPYSESQRNTMILGDPIRAEKDWKDTERKCVEPLLKYYFNGNFTATTSDHTSILKIAAIAAAAAAAAAIILFILLGR